MPNFMWTKIKSRTYMRVRLIPRPWKTPEGTVNRPVLKMMLEGVLMFIMNQPGVTLKTLYDKYSPILQPVAALELVDVRLCFSFSFLFENILSDLQNIIL